MWVKNDNKHWSRITRKILRFGELSSIQREVEKLRGLEEGKVYLKCEGCDGELKAIKHADRNRDYRWDLVDWKAVIRKTQVEKGKTGYFITTRIEFYCSDCQNQSNKHLEEERKYSI